MTGFGLPAGLFLMGLIGGAAHCAGMCGPFVLAQVGNRLAATPVDQATRLVRLRGAALLPYHFGRLTTYTALGAAAPVAAGGIGSLLIGGQVPAFALIAASLVFLTLAADQLLPKRSVAGFGSIAGVWHRLLAPFFAKPTGASGYVLGVGLGFLPCGMLYSALLLVGASGDWRRGALGMAAFSLGTMPALFAVGGLGVVLRQRLRQSLRRFLVPILIFNAVLAALMAWRWLAAS